MARKRRAEVVFVENASGMSWFAKIVNEQQAIDERTKEPAVRRGLRRYSARIVRNVREGYDIVTEGAHKSSRRYSWAGTYARAQAAIASWARRRFYYEEDAA